MAFHITPQYYFYHNLPEFSKRSETDSRWNFHSIQLTPGELINYEQVFIVGDPGYGKTTLVDNIKKYLEDKVIKFNYSEGKTFEELNYKEIRPYLIFDALDECKNYTSAFKQILDYTTKNEVRLIVSTRSHYISNIKNSIENLNFVFAQILPFNQDQIATFLLHHLKELSFTGENVQGIIEKSKQNNELSILRVPRYLNEFKNYILQSKLKPNEVESLTKSQLFEKVIYHNLELQHVNSNKVFLVKRVLERLSLLMEIFEVNQLPKEDFITFLDQASSNINLVFLSSIEIDEVLNRDLKSIAGDILLFEHTEFQEYLAAKEVIRLGNKFQTLFDLMVEPGLKVIPPNWIDVLSFVIDMDHQMIKPILAFIRFNDYQNIDEKLIKMILSVSPRNFQEDFKKSIFRVAFDYYYKADIIVYDNADELAAYATTGTEELFPIFKNSDINLTVRHVINNQINIIESLATHKKLDENSKGIWIAYIKDLLHLEDFLPVRVSLFYALSSLGATETILSLNHYFAHLEDYIFKDYLYILSKNLPDHPNTIDLIFDSLLRKRRIDGIETIIGNISEEENLIALFGFYTKNPQLLEQWSSQTQNHYTALFKTANDKFSPSLGKVMEDFVLSVTKCNHYSWSHSKLVLGSFSILLKKNKRFLDRLLKCDNAYRWLGNIAPEIINIITIKEFKKLEKYFAKNNAYWNFGPFINNFKDRYENFPENPLYKYVEKKYLIEKRLLQQSQPVPLVTKDLVGELREYYLDNHSYYNTGLVPFLINNKNELLTIINEEDRKYILEVISTVLSRYNPDLFNITIDKVEPNRTTFSHNSDDWFSIEIYFNAAYLLNDLVLLKTYKDKFLKTIPRFDLNSQDDIESFKSLISQIGGIDEAETAMLFDFCINRQDDYLLLTVRSFSAIIKLLDLEEFKPLLQKFIKSEVIHNFDRVEAMKIFGEMAKTDADAEFLRDLFNSTNDNGKMDLKELADEYLIKKFEDADAITWRFDQLKFRKRKINPDNRYNGIRAVSAFESEMDHAEFAKCFYGFKNKQIQDRMLDLLSYSFDIRGDFLHYKYSSYLQRIVYEYFKSVLDKKNLGLVTKAVNQFSKPELTYSFSSLLLKLTMNHHADNQSNKTFMDAILKYNNILQKSYLDIGSNEELKDMLMLILNRDITNLIENEGFYRVANQLSGSSYKRSPSNINEELIQKTLKIAFEKALLENGFRKVDIYREVETLDGLKHDYIINYGLYGPIVVELKLLNNKEIQNLQERNRYKEKLKKYLKANRNQGLYVIFQTRENQSHVNSYNSLVKEYDDIQGLEITLIKCF